MCGRYALTLPPEAMRKLMGYPEQPNFPPRYNIAPTQPVAVVVEREGGPHFMLMRWGFIPGWVKDMKAFPLVINVRSETIREKPSFRAAFIRRRCLMPTDGFYEWHRSGSENRAYLFRRPDRGLFAFAAIWETWNSPDGSEIDTVALINGPANGLMSAIHERCPVVIAPEDAAAWMNPAATPDQAQALLKPPPDDLLEMVRIGPAVNKVANDGPEVQEIYVPGKTLEPSPDPAPRSRPELKRVRSKTENDQGSLF
jgi:putative SOS response-associated peptidase YedK